MSKNPTSLPQICISVKETKLGRRERERIKVTASNLWKSAGFKPSLSHVGDVDHHGKVVTPCLTPLLTPVGILLAGYEQECGADRSLQIGSSISPFSSYGKFLLCCSDWKLSSGIIHSRIWLSNLRFDLLVFCCFTSLFYHSSKTSVFSQ